MPTIRLEIVTAERVVYEEDVDIVVLPGVEGQLGILPHHAPLLTALQPGELMARKDGQETVMALSGGFAQVLGDKVIVLADAAERDEEIDEQRAQEAVRRAQEQLEHRTADLDLEQAVAAMRRAQTRLRVAQRRRRREPGQAPPQP